MRKKNLLMTAISAIAAITVMSMGGASVSAADTVDFEDGGYSFASVDSSGAGSAKLSVVNFGGSKKLKIDVADSSKETKIKFDLGSIIDSGKFESVKSISMELMVESKDGKTSLGKMKGSVGTQGGKSADTPSWAKTTWEFKQDGTVTESLTIERKFIMVSDKLVNNTSDTYMILVKSPNKVECNMYIDNIKLIDDSGNAMTLKIGGNAAAAVTEAVTEATTTEAVTEPVTEATTTEAITEAVTEAALEEEEAPGDEPIEVVEEVDEPEDKKDESKEEKDPDSDSKTTPSTTGNLSAFAAAGALVISGYAVSMTRSKKKAKSRFYSVS